MRRDTENKFALAIDLGGGGPKVGIVSSQGELVAVTRRSTDTYLLPDGGAEQDPEQWWQTISDAAQEVIGKNVVPAHDIVAVGCTSHWSVTTPVDADGRPLMNAVYWLDTRGAPYTRAITDGFPKVAGYGLGRLIHWLRLTGGAPTHSGADVLAHILFIKHERPELYRQTHKFLEPMDYVNLRLTGRMVASYGTIFPYLLTDNRDNRRIDYSPRLLALAGVEREKLPDLVPVDSVLGTLRPEVAQEWGLSPQVRVVAGSCDSQAAVVGSGAVGDYQPHMCVGTSSWLSCHVPFKRTDLIRFVATMPAAVPGRNMVVAEQGAAGKCLDLFLNEWLFPRAAQATGGDRAESQPPQPTAQSQSADAEVFQRAFELAAAAPPGSGGLLFLPWLNGAGPPQNDSHARGGFLNQSLRTTQADAIRAVLEGVSMNLRWLLDAVERFVSRRFDVIHHIGGGARSNLWCQIHADILNRKIRQVEQPNHAILRGAGLLALLALGHLQMEDVPRCVPIARTFEPRPEYRRVYDELFSAFQQAYRSNRRLFARLNGLPSPGAAATTTGGDR